MKKRYYSKNTHNAIWCVGGCLQPFSGIKKLKLTYQNGVKRKAK